MTDRPADKVNKTRGVNQVKWQRHPIKVNKYLTNAYQPRNQAEQVGKAVATLSESVGARSGAH